MRFIALWWHHDTPDTGYSQWRIRQTPKAKFKFSLPAIYFKTSDFKFWLFCQHLILRASNTTTRFSSRSSILHPKNAPETISEGQKSKIFLGGACPQQAPYARLNCILGPPNSRSTTVQSVVESSWAKYNHIGPCWSAVLSGRAK